MGKTLKRTISHNFYTVGPGMGPRRGKRIAPNLESEEDFPMLGCESQAIIDSAW